MWLFGDEAVYLEFFHGHLGDVATLVVGDLVGVVGAVVVPLQVLAEPRVPVVRRSDHLLEVIAVA